MVNCLLNDNEVTALWDNGAQVSIMTKGVLEEILPGTVVRDISELINVGLDLMVANGTKIPFTCWAEVREQLSSGEEKQEVHVPFLITLDRLEMPILGYNVIEELVRMNRWQEEPTLGSSLLKSFKAGFVDSDESQLQALINLIQVPEKGYLCTLRTSKKATVISRGQTAKVSGRANTAPVTSNMPVLF